MATTASIYEVLSDLFDKAQHIRFRKTAQQHKNEAKVDSETGATQKPNASAQVFKLQVSLHNHHLNILVRDKSSRKLAPSADDRDLSKKQDWERFNWRAITVCRFLNRLHVPQVDGYVSGEWQEVHLGARRFWPRPPETKEMIQSFVAIKNEIANLKGLETLLKSRAQKIKSKDLDKTKVYHWTDADGKVWEIKNSSGKTDKVFDGDEEVKKVRTIHPNKEIYFSLSNRRSDRPAPKTIDEKMLTLVELVKIRQKMKELNKIVRPIELGIIEDYAQANDIDDLSRLDNVEVDFGGETFTIKVRDGSSYDYPDGIAERLARGELTQRTVETRAQWSIKVKEPEFENVPESKKQMEEVNV